METERVRIRRRHGAFYLDQEVEVPSAGERLRIARELHADRKLAAIQVLGWTVLYKPRLRFTITTTPFDPFTGASTGEATTGDLVSESCCTFGHLEDWTVCYKWKSEEDDEPIFVQVNPPPISESPTFLEGARYRVEGDWAERSPSARQACLQHYGMTCYICGFDGRIFYGAEAGAVIHVHHVNPLSIFTEEHRVDPVRDLRPLCPNCHNYVHSDDPPLNAETLRARFQPAQSSSRTDQP